MKYRYMNPRITMSVPLTRSRFMWYLQRVVGKHILMPIVIKCYEIIEKKGLLPEPPKELLDETTL